MDGDMKMEKRR